MLNVFAVACSQDAFKHFLLDLERTSDIHPVVTKMEIVGEQKEGIGMCKDNDHIIHALHIDLILTTVTVVRREAQAHSAGWNIFLRDRVGNERC